MQEKKGMLGSLCRLKVATFGHRCGTVPTRHGLSTAKLCMLKTEYLKPFPAWARAYSCSVYVFCGDERTMAQMIA